MGARAETAVAALSTGAAGAQAGLRQEPGDGGGGGRFGDAANRTPRDRAMLGAVCPVSQRKPLKSLLENGAGLTCFHAERFGECER